MLQRCANFGTLAALRAPIVLNNRLCFQVALQLEPGTLEDFRAFCEQTGASPELGLSVGDFTAAYAETPSEKLDEIILVSCASPFSLHFVWLRTVPKQPGASWSLGLLSAPDRTRATLTARLGLLLLLQVHGREWSLAQQAAASAARSDNLPGLGGGNNTSWAFDPSGIYGFDEAVLLVLLFVCALCCTATGARNRRWGAQSQALHGG